MDNYDRIFISLIMLVTWGLHLQHTNKILDAIPQSNDWVRISTDELDSLRKEYVNLILEEQRLLDSLQTGKQLMVK